MPNAAGHKKGSSALQMPRGRPKKQLQAIQEDEVLEDVEGQEQTAPAIDEEKMQVIQQLEAEVQERAAALLAMAEAECRSILHDFTVQLMKLPKQVREVPLGEFTSKYGGDVNAMLMDNINQRLQAAKKAPSTAAQGAEAGTAQPARTVRKTRNTAAADGEQNASDAAATAAKGGRRKRGMLESLQENAVEATPMPGDKSRAVPFTPAAAATVMRAPRLGEMFYSQTGSPLGVVEEDPQTKQAILSTVAKGGRSLKTPMPTAAAASSTTTVATVLSKKAGGRRGAAAPESMVVTCSDGEVVTVNLANGPGLGSVPARYQKEVATQLEALRKLATAALTNVTKRR